MPPLWSDALCEMIQETDRKILSQLIPMSKEQFSALKVTCVDTPSLCKDRVAIITPSELSAEFATLEFRKSEPPML